VSAASGVPTEPAAQRSGTVGATVAGATADERAQPACGDIDSVRDRNAFDDGRARSRSGNGSDTANVVRARGGGVPEALAPNSSADCSALVKARKSIAEAGSPQPKTQANYLAKSKLLIAAMDKFDGDAAQRFTQALSPYAPKANSFFAMRAALAWRTREEIRRLLGRHDNMLRPEEVTDRQRVLEQIKESLRILDVILGIQRAALLKSTGQASKRVRSKRSDLGRFDPDWREQVLKAGRDGAYEEVIWVLVATGCRPAELRRGVVLNLEWDHVHVRIAGSKVTGSSGQLWRELKVNWDWMPEGMFERLHGRVDYVVKIRDDALRGVVARIGRKLWPKRKRLCPYHCRHEAAADMRESGWSADEIAAALGHRVSETASRYGPRRRPGQGGRSTKPQIRRGGVATAVPVRPLAKAFDSVQVLHGRRNRPRTDARTA
jgi:integrase